MNTIPVALDAEALELGLQAAADAHGGYMGESKTRAATAAIRAYLAAKPETAEPVAWLASPEIGGGITNAPEEAKRWIAKYPDKVTPLYAALSPVQDGVSEAMVEAGAAALWLKLKLKASIGMTWEEAKARYPGEGLLPAGLRADAKAVLEAALSSQGERL